MVGEREIVTGHRISFWVIQATIEGVRGFVWLQNYGTTRYCVLGDIHGAAQAHDGNLLRFGSPHDAFVFAKNQWAFDTRVNAIVHRVDIESREVVDHG